MISIFMNTTFDTIIAFLAILCIQLIYSLMLSDVEEKTFEFGMLRALGFNKGNVIATVLHQGLSFAVPGIVFGMIAAFGANYGARTLMFKLTQNTASYMLSTDSIWLGVALGFLIPLFSNIIPIQRAFGKNLRSSLDLYHRQTDEVSIQVKTN